MNTSFKYAKGYLKHLHNFNTKSSIHCQWIIQELHSPRFSIQTFFYDLPQVG